MNERIRESALQAKRLGYDVVLLKEDQKIPAFERWQEKALDYAELDYWTSKRRFNWGVFLGMNLLVVDKDQVSRKVYDWMRHWKIYGSAMEVRTRRGVHFYFRLPVGIGEVRSRIKHLEMPVDLLMGNRVTVGPGSVVGGFEYQLREGTTLVRPEELPVFPLEILRPKEVIRPLAPLVSKGVDSVRKYIRFIVARCYSGAHGQAFRCAIKIAERVNDFSSAMELYREWNQTNAVADDGKTPFPFSERELQHKMSDAFRIARGRK